MADHTTINIVIDTTAAYTYLAGTINNYYTLVSIASLLLPYCHPRSSSAKGRVKQFLQRKLI